MTEDTNKENEEAIKDELAEAELTEEVEVDAAAERDVDFEALDKAPSLEGFDMLSELDSIKTELREQKEKYLLLFADFDNYKKRVVKERSELLKYQGERVLVDILEVADNLERALGQDESQDFDTLKSGVEMIQKLFIDTLKKWGVEAVESQGKAFDPKTQNALSVVETDEHEPNMVVEEFKKAYNYKDKLLRPAEVIVSAKLKVVDVEEVEAEESQE